MKILNTIIVIVLALLTSCKTDNRQITSDMIHFPAGDGTSDPDAPVIVFDSIQFNFGTIAIGEKVTHVYRFKNEGKSPLVISQVNPSCGCTIPKEWPKDPIAPGDTGEIMVEFNSKGSPGKIDKNISIVTNCIPKVWDLKIVGEVIGVEAPADDKKGMEMEFETH